MRDLMNVRAESVRMAAVQGNWTREPSTGPDGAPSIRWHGWLHQPGRESLPIAWESDDPEWMVQPIREAMRAFLVGWLSGTCRICEAKTAWLTEEQLAEADLRRVAVIRFWRSDLGPGQMVYVLEHAAECPVRPAHIDLMARAGSN